MTELLAAIAAYGLPSSRAALPRAPLSALDWWKVRQGVREQRLAGLLGAAIADGAFPVTDDQAEAAIADRTEATCRVLFLERMLLRVVERFETAGVECRVLKGSAAAHLDYDEPALRLFRDVDLLVRPEQFEGAVAVLVEAGCQRRFPEPRPGFDRRFSKGASFRTPDGFEIDLHRTFVMGPFGLTVDLAELWSTEAQFDLGGRTLAALATEERFLHACFHTVLGDVPPRLAPQRDVAQMLTGSDLDLDAVRATSASLAQRRRDGTRGPAQLGHPATHLDQPLASWAASYRPRRCETRALHEYVEVGESFAGKSVAAVRVVPGARNKLAYVRALALPDRAYVKDRHRGHVSRWWAGTRAVLRHRGGR